jgi:hypothetical protein
MLIIFLSIKVLVDFSAIAKKNQAAKNARSKTAKNPPPSTEFLAHLKLYC